MIYWMVFTETIQVQGIAGLAESPGSLLMLTVGEIHLQSILCFWPELLFLFRAASSSEQRGHSALGKNECEWVTQARQPTYNSVPSSLLSLWSWYSHATRHLELKPVSVKWQRTDLGVFEKKERAIQAKAQEPGFKEQTHWENCLRLQMKLGPARRSTAAVWWDRTLVGAVSQRLNTSVPSQHWNPAIQVIFLFLIQNSNSCITFHWNTP